MTFDEWWDKQEKDFSKNALPNEIRYFADMAWDAATLDSYKKGFADGKRAAMAIINQTFNEYLVK